MLEGRTHAFVSEYLGMTPADDGQSRGVVITVRPIASLNDAVNLMFTRAQLERMLEDGEYILEAYETLRDEPGKEISLDELFDIHEQRIDPAGS